jgi:hypothetical protein
MPLLLLLFVDCCLPLPSSLPPPPLSPRFSRCCCHHDHHPPSKFIVVIFIILSFADVNVIVGVAPVAIVNNNVMLGPHFSRGCTHKKLASFRHKTQKFFFLAGSLSDFFW